MEPLYPLITDKDFQKKIFEKEEFNNTKYPKNYYDNVTIEEKCNASSFNVENHQIFLSRFMSPETPYKSLLLFHGVGTGKTCAALTIAEGYKRTLLNIQKRLKIQQNNRSIKYYNYPGVYVISSRAIQKVFRNELFNTNKVPREETPGILHCIGNEYFPMNDDSESVNANQKIQVGRKILSYYNFFGPTEFSNFVKKIENSAKLKDFFSHSVFIIDEVHNVISEEKSIKQSNINDETNDDKIMETLKKIFKEAENTRLVMLSATPMCDDEESIINILTLLRYNDGIYDEVDKTKLFPKDSIDHEYLAELSRGYVSYLRGNNPISFPKMVMPPEDKTYKPNPTVKMNVNEDYEQDIRMYTLFKCVMSDFQYEIYLKNEEEHKNAFSQIKLREAATIVFPNEEIGDNGFNKSFKIDNKVYSMFGNNFLKEDTIQTYSIKIYELLKLARTNPGLHYIYSLFDKSGALTIALAFEANGYAIYSKEGTFDNQGIFSGGRKLLNYSPRVYRCSVCGNLKDEEHKDHSFKQGTFILFTGVEITGVQDALQVYNSSENKNGDIIKFFIGTLISAEGVDYKRIKHLHVINPWYNFTRTWQAIGRGLRNCSQADFPEGDRNVVVYLYSSTPAERSVETIDEYMYRLSLEKDIRIKDVERTLKTVSIDCALNKEANMYASDKDYSRECDYKKCNYECMSVSSQNEELNKDTNIVKNDDPIIRKAINMIFLLFKEKVFYSLEEILEKLQNSVKKEYIFIALTKYLENRITLKDKLNRKGFMIYKNGYYYYQPNEFDDTNAPLVYKKTPLKIKDKKIRINPPPSTQDKNVSNNIPKEKEKEINIDILLNEMLTKDNFQEMSYYLDRNNENTIIELTKKILNKQEIQKKLQNNNKKDSIEENIKNLLEYLYKINFVLKYEENNENYWNKDEKIYFGCYNTYWNNNNETIMHWKDSEWVQERDIIKRLNLRDNSYNKNSLASTIEKGCNLHGIMTKRGLLLLINPGKISSDSRTNPRGKNISSFTLPQLKEHYKCLTGKTENQKKDYFQKAIELELKSKHLQDEEYIWIKKTD